MFHLTGLDIGQRENQGIVVLELHGKLHMGSGDVALREFAESLLAQGKRQVIIDLSKVSGIDDAGTQTLLILAEKYRGAGGRLVLLGLDPAHVEIYEAAHLDSAVGNYPSEVDAVNSFFPDRATAHYDILEYVEDHAHEDHTHEEKDHKS
jgi:anti-sigma B factor antagonist